MNIFDSSIPHLAKNIQLAINLEGESESKFPFFGDFVSYPPIRKQIILLLRQFIVLGRKLVLRLIGRGYVWQVGYQRSSSWRDFSLTKVVWIENPRGSFLADPCILHWNNKAYIYVEQYFYKAKRV